MPNHNATAATMAAKLLDHCRANPGTDFFAAIIGALHSDAMREGLPLAGDCLVALEYCRARSAGHYPRLIPGVMVERSRRNPDGSTSDIGAGAQRLADTCERVAEMIRSDATRLPEN